MRRPTFAALATIALAAAPLGAQENLLPSTSWGFSPVVSGWHFATPIATPGGAVADVAQVAVPFQVRAVVGGRWTFDVTGAYATAAAHMNDKSGSGGNGGGNGGGGGGGGGGGVMTLSGPTDLKLRMSGPVIGDGVVVTAGVNIPTGTSRLNSDQTTVLQAVGAPALHMAVPAYGVGAGGTLGFITAVERAGWAFAFGASVEKRTEYTPIALALSDGSSETKLTPGIAEHVTLGADGVVGSSRLSLLLLGDGYAADKISVLTSGTSSGATQYQLGPQVGAIARLDFGGGAWSEGALTVSARRRTEFKDATGTAVAGSAASYLEGSLGGVLGGAGHAGLVIGVDGRWHSGMPFTTQLVGAAVTAVGGTLGVEFPAGVRFLVHPQYGSFDTGATKTTGLGATIALSIFAKREAQ